MHSSSLSGFLIQVKCGGAALDTSPCSPILALSRTSKSVLGLGPHTATALVLSVKKIVSGVPD